MERLTRNIQRMAGACVGALISIPLLVVPVPAQQPSAQEILEEAAKAAQAGLDSIRGYTLVQRVLHERITTRWTRPERSDSTVTLRFQIEGQGTGSDPRNRTAAMLASLTSPMTLATVLRRTHADNFVVSGSGVLRGTSTWVLVLPEAEDVTIPFSSGAEAPEMTIWVGTHDHRIRRVEVVDHGAAGSPDPRQMRRIDYRDFREVDGVVHPFRVELTMPGLEDVPRREYEQVAANVARLRTRLSQLPAARRAEAEATIERAEGRMENLNGLIEVLAERSANPPIVVETLELRVDPPGG